MSLQNLINVDTKAVQTKNLILSLINMQLIKLLYEKVNSIHTL